MCISLGCPTVDLGPGRWRPYGTVQANKTKSRYWNHSINYRSTAIWKIINISVCLCSLYNAVLNNGAKKTYCFWQTSRLKTKWFLITDSIENSTFFCTAVQIPWICQLPGNWYSDTYYMQLGPGTRYLLSSLRYPKKLVFCMNIIWTNLLFSMKDYMIHPVAADKLCY